MITEAQRRDMLHRLDHFASHLGGVGNLHSVLLDIVMALPATDSTPVRGAGPETIGHAEPVWVDLCQLVTDGEVLTSEALFAETFERHPGDVTTSRTAAIRAVLEAFGRARGVVP